MLETSVQYLDIIHWVQILKKQYFFSIFVHLKALILLPKFESNIW